MAALGWLFAMCLALEPATSTPAATPPTTNPDSRPSAPATAPTTAPASQPAPAGEPPKLNVHMNDKELKAWLEPPPAGKPQPQLDFSPASEIDGGVIWRGQTDELHWTLKNVGAAPLHVNILGGCYTNLSRGAWVRVLEPGASDTLDLCAGAFVSCGLTGRQKTHAATIRSNDATQPATNLYVTYDFRRAFDAYSEGYQGPHVFLKAPPDGPQYGDRPVPRTVPVLRGTVVLTRGDGGPLAPRFERFDPPWPDGQAQAVFREIDAGEQYALDVELRPPWPNKIDGKVCFTTGVPESPTGFVSLSGGLAHRLRCGGDPSLRTIPRVRPEALVEWKGRLYWSDDSPPGHITAIICPVAGVNGWIEERDGKLILIVTVDSDCPAPRYGYHKVKLRTDDPVVPELEVEVPGVSWK